MKLLILSDLDQSPERCFQPGTDFDLAILAGNISTPASQAVHRVRDSAAFPGAKAIVFVPGECEHGSGLAQLTIKEMRKAARGSNVYPLDCDEIIINKVRFLGCTLWTDFTFRIETSAVFMSSVRLAQDAAVRAAWNDEASYLHLLVPEQIQALHRIHRAWLFERLNQPYAGKTVVVTRHAPHRNSIPLRYLDDWLTASFANELPSIFFEVPCLWVHGHGSQSVDYQIGNCRVVSNPRGFLPKSPGLAQNPGFNSKHIVEV